MNRKRQASESDDAQASTSAKAGAVKKKRQDKDKGLVKTELTHGTVDLLRVLFYGGTTQLSSTKNRFRRP